MNKPQPMRRATLLDEVPYVLREKPLAVEELDAFYVDTSEARGGQRVRARLARELRQNRTGKEHILFVGYKGCGKSTELNHLQRDLEEDFLVVNYSILKELDGPSLFYAELFIVTMEKVFQAAEEHKLILSENYIRSIQQWIGSEQIKEITKEHNLAAEAEVGAKIGLPFLVDFFAKFRASAKNSRSMKDTLKQKIDPRISDLIAACNDLLREVNTQLIKRDKQGLLLMIEDLDKIPLNRAEELFFNYAGVITQLEAYIVYTFPVALYHHGKFNTIKPQFSNVLKLQMIKDHEPDGSPNEIGMQVLRQVVEQRLEVAKLFTDAQLLDRFIHLSGGILRDLFRLLDEAAGNALDYGRDQIGNEDFERARNQLKQEYENNLAEYQDLTVEQFYAVLQPLAVSTTKTLEHTAVANHLLQNLSIVGYNGQGWYDVHPIIREILQQRNKLD